MISRCFFVLCLLFAVIGAFFVAKPLVCAQCTAPGVPMPFVDVWVRDIHPVTKVLDSFSVRIERPLNQGGAYTHYANGVHCGDTSHRTRKGNRFFAHARVNFAFGDTGEVRINNIAPGVAFTITKANVKAYWDDVYGIESSGGESTTYNCFGYSFGYSTWIQSSERIYEDDYVELTDGAVEMLDNVNAEYVVEVGTNAHVASVLWTCGAENNVPLMETCEKMQNSGLYHFYWDAVLYQTAAGSATGYYKRKP